MQLLSTRGFTLMELLIVVSILGILSSIIFTNISDTRRTARNLTRTNGLNQIRLAINSYEASYNSFPIDLSTNSYVFGNSANNCDLQCGFQQIQSDKPVLSPSSEPIAVTLILNPVDDATVYQFQSNSNFGKDKNIETYPWAPHYSKRFYIKFNLDNIPPHTTIDSAVIRFKKQGNRGFRRTIDLHAVNESGWSQDSITWTNAPNFISNSLSSIQPVWQGRQDYVEADVLKDIENMILTDRNFGWVVKDRVEDSSQDFWRFSSSEGSHPPELVVNYSHSDETNESQDDETETTNNNMWNPSDSCFSFQNNERLLRFLKNPPIDPSGDNSISGYAIYRQGNETYLRACFTEDDEYINLKI